jgi:putative thioredoxin
MADSAWVTTANDENFETAVLERSKQVPVLVDFWAEWCGPCRVLGPLLEKLANEFAGQFVLVKIDVDRAPMLAAQFQVSSIPAVMAIVDGTLAGQFLGALPESQIRDFLRQILPSEADRLLKTAEQLEATQPAAACEAYSDVLKLDPKNTLALAALAEMALGEGALDRAAELVETIRQGDAGWDRAQRVKSRLEFQATLTRGGSLAEIKSRAEANPNDRHARLELGLAQAAIGDYPAALETLVAIVEADREFGKEHAKDPIVRIFSIVGPQTALANEYRARLARALY